MEKFKIIYQEYFNWIDKHLKLILLIPAILGGLWQLYELSSISTSYIRFFSLSQVVPDGLMWLFVISIFYGTYRLIASFYKLKSLSFFIRKVEREKLKFTIGLSLVLIIATTIMTAYFLIPGYQDLSDNGSISEVLPLLVLSFIVLFTFLIAILSVLSIIHEYTRLGDFISRWLTKKKADNVKSDEANEEENKALSFLAKILFWIVLGLMLKYIFFPVSTYIGKIKSEFILPKNLKNLEYIERKINSVYGKNEEFKIRYINDMYIFLEIQNGALDEDIMVLKFDELLEQDNCSK